MKIEELKSKLNEFHKNLGIPILKHISDLAGNQFHGEFNVSGFHREILALPESAKSFFGIDKCMRLKEVVGPFSSFVFHMGVYAESIDLGNSFSDPFKDKRFFELQNQIIKQFFSLIDFFGIDKSKVEATYLDETKFGSGGERDKLLGREYFFPQDKESRNIFEINSIKAYPVKSIQNIDIRPIEGALVGPRVEIAYKGMEIATIVFNCFKIQDRKLIPINYVGGYAVGIERLSLALSNKEDLIETNVENIERLNEIAKSFPAIESSLFSKERYIIVYGIAVLEVTKRMKNLSVGQKKTLRSFKKILRKTSNKIGFSIGEN